MMPDEYRDMIAAARGTGLPEYNRDLLAVLNNAVPPHATVLCHRAIMEGGRAVYCGAKLEHVIGGNRTLTVCPRCDRYDERMDR